jgi:predicted Zn-dependent peptidase
MVFKGTKKRSARKISEEIEAYGGYLNAFTSKEHTCYYSRGLSGNLERTFSVLSDIVQNPLFKDYHIKKEAGVVIDELRDIDDNPEELIFDKFEEIIFSGSKLSLPVIGSEKNIKKFNSLDLFKYHRSKYKTGNMLIVASGAVEHEKLIELAKKYVQSEKPYNVLRKEKYSKKKFGKVVLDKEINQVHSIIGRSTVGFKNNKRVPIKILTTLLGDGSSSRLFQSVREKMGITYQINSFLNSYEDISSFGVYFSTNTNQAEKVSDIVFKEFKKLRKEKVPEKELKKVKEYIKGSTLLSLESTTNRMIRIANSMLYYNKIYPVDYYLNKIEAVTSDKLIDIANELLDEKKMTSVILRSVKEKISAAA